MGIAMDLHFFFINEIDPWTQLSLHEIHLISLLFGQLIPLWHSIANIRASYYQTSETAWPVVPLFKVITMWKVIMNFANKVKKQIMWSIMWSLHNKYISIAQCKTAISPVLMHWRYCSLALSHLFYTITHILSYVPTWHWRQSCHQLSDISSPLDMNYLFNMG